MVSYLGNIRFFGGLLGKDVSSPFKQLESAMCCGSPISRLRSIRCLSDFALRSLELYFGGVTDGATAIIRG